MKRITKIFTLLCFMISFGVLAQPNPEEHKAHKKEIKAYFKENIFPVLKAERAAFDNKLSATDKTKINELRAKLKALRPELKKFHHQNPDQELQGNPAAHQAHAQLRRIMLEAWVIADNYEQDLKAIHEKWKPQAEKWKNDIKALVEKNADNHPKHEHRHFHHLKKHLMPPAFILLDPNAKDINGMEDDQNQDENTLQNQVFPNPSLNGNTLDFRVEQEGNVRISLQDRNGKAVKEVLNQSLLEGQHQIKVDTAELPNGLYYYQIQTQKGLQTQKFIKE